MQLATEASPPCPGPLDQGPHVFRSAYFDRLAHMTQAEDTAEVGPFLEYPFHPLSSQKAKVAKVKVFHQNETRLCTKPVELGTEGDKELTGVRVFTLDGPIAKLQKRSP